MSLEMIDNLFILNPTISLPLTKVERDKFAVQHKTLKTSAQNCSQREILGRPWRNNDSVKIRPSIQDLGVTYSNFFYYMNKTRRDNGQ